MRKVVENFDETPKDNPHTDTLISENQIIRVERKIFQKKVYLDIRKYYSKRENREQWFPTTRGISIPIEFAVHVIDAAKQQGVC